MDRMKRFIFTLSCGFLTVPCAYSAHSLELSDFILAPKDCQLLKSNFYYSCYDKEHRIPKWTLHELIRSQLNGAQPRTNNFKADTRVSTPVSPGDFRYSGYDRGHMVPAADMRLNYTSMSETFLMTNISVQRPEFNRGIWRVLENRIRKEFLATNENSHVFVFTGPILEEFLPRLQTGISIPKYFYKVIYSATNKKLKAYLISNNRYSSSELESFRVSVDRIEKLTKMDFFSFLEDSLEDQLESRI